MNEALGPGIPGEGSCELHVGQGNVAPYPRMEEMDCPL